MVKVATFIQHNRCHWDKNYIFLLSEGRTKHCSCPAWTEEQEEPAKSEIDVSNEDSLNPPVLLLI